jgi:hypothetical protein
VEDLYSKVLAFLGRNIGAARTDVPVAAHD